jgi:negative regulator of flagellin synthesis FlgM
MEIRSGLDGLNSLLGVNGANGAGQSKSRGAVGASALGADHATLSSAASEMSQAAGEDGVRMEKVTAVQAALADGTYSVPASAVASKVIDSMLGGK